MHRGQPRTTLRCPLSMGLAVWGLVVVMAGPHAIAQSRVPVPQPQGGRPESPCYAEHTHNVSPEWLLLGEAPTITLRVTALCVGLARPTHVALVLDASESVSPRARRDVRTGVSELLRRLDLRNDPEKRIGVVGFDDHDICSCKLSNEAPRVRHCIGRALSGRGVGLPAGVGDPARDLGLEEGLRVLLRGRQLTEVPLPPNAIRESLILVSDGNAQQGCPGVLQSANHVKEKGFLLVTVCAGRSCHEGCLRRAATAPRYFYERLDPDELAELPGLFVDTP